MTVGTVAAPDELPSVDAGVLVDTSVILPYLDGDDIDHNLVRAAFKQLGESTERLYIHQYVIVEANALVHRRLGFEVARRFNLEFLPTLEFVMIDRSRHQAALDRWLAGPSSVSFVDAMSFEVMHAHGIPRAFALDGDFANAGFDLVPLVS